MRYIQRGLMYGHVLSVKRNLRHITRDEGESGLGKTVRLSINSQVPIFVFTFVFVFFFFQLQPFTESHKEDYKHERWISVLLKLTLTAWVCA